MRCEALTSVVLSYNRVDVLETCLLSARVAGHVVVVDKSSTDGAAEIGRRMADRFVQVPWSPTVEDTRAAAVGLATTPWVLVLDDDECLNREAMLAVAEAVRNPQGSVYRFPFRTFLLGRHDPAAFYWPEYHIRLFRRGSVLFPSTVHAGIQPQADDTVTIPAESGAAVMHFSHRDAATWIEKTNRYTSRPERASAAMTPAAIMAMMEHYMAKVAPSDPDGYLTAAAALRGLYDVVDAVKRWEAARGTSGAEMFRRVCQELQADYAALMAETAA